MKSARTRTTFRQIAGVALTIGFIAALAGAPARADDRDHGRDNHRDQRHWGHEAPRQVYAPPVYYAPAPAPPVIDFVFPLRFR